MGDLSASDGSWKKLVIAKANNKWRSTVKTKPDEMDDSVGDSQNSSEDDQVLSEDELTLDKVKKEQTNNSVQRDFEAEIDITIEQELDPLSLLQPVKRRRRKSSGEATYEPSEARSSRLARMSAYAAERLANESPEDRAKRLKRMSAYSAKRLAHETTEQRARRLARMSAYAAKRLANETSEQREARLARMSAYASRRKKSK